MPVSLYKADFAHLKNIKTEENTPISGEDIEDGEIEDQPPTTVEDKHLPKFFPTSRRRLSVTDSEASSRPSSPPPVHAAELPPPQSETDMVAENPTELSPRTSPTLKPSASPFTPGPEKPLPSRFNSPQPGLRTSSPLLAMSSENYGRAKELVLDLLGWGVPPEYLVDCGVSPESIYRIFAELHLQFPANLQLDPSWPLVNM